MGNRTIFRFMLDKLTGRKRLRVAVVGTRNSGKSVFLASLANHLMAHDPERFPLLGWHVACEGEAPVPDVLPRYDYLAARNALRKGRWPAKTKDASVLALDLALRRRDSSKKHHIRLEILDIPGERIADFSMEGRSFREWSSWMEESLAGPLGISEEYRAYLAAVRNLPSPDEDALLGLYRSFIAGEYAAYSPLIVPASVKLGLAKPLEKDEISSTFASIPVGLDAEHQFAPLPRECFSTSSPMHALAKKFAHAYTLYRKRMVEPLMDWRREANVLVCLADIPAILRNGPHAWDGERTLLHAALDVFGHARSPSPAARLHGWLANVLWRTHIDAAYVVATKADTVPEGASREHLSILAGKLLGNALVNLDLAASGTEILACAAVCTTSGATDGDGKPALEGVLETDPGNISRYRVPEVPPSWPASAAEWQKKIAEHAFDYPRTVPAFDERMGNAPDHIGLHDVALRILSAALKLEETR
ncbi:MAG: YcjX family protein [Kiritimatiellae bacterium]|nr:YcjX family protein [Kiritimatiellia bacterium]